MIARVEELAAKLDLNVLAQRDVLDHRQIQIVHAVGAKSRELGWEGAQIVRQLLRGVAIEPSRIERAIDVPRIEAQISAEIDQVAPSQRRTRLHRVDRVYGPATDDTVQDW